VERPSDGRFTKEIKENMDTDTGDKLVCEVKEKSEGFFMEVSVDDDDDDDDDDVKHKISIE
jgi:hypothetical protein